MDSVRLRVHSYIFGDPVCRFYKNGSRLYILNCVILIGESASKVCLKFAVFCLALFSANVTYDLTMLYKVRVLGRMQRHDTQGQGRVVRCTWQTGRGLGYRVPIIYPDLNLSVLQHTFSNVLFICGLDLDLEPCNSALLKSPLPLPFIIRMRMLIRQSNLTACLIRGKVQQDEKHSRAFMSQS